MSSGNICIEANHERLAKALERHDDYRVLRRLSLPVGPVNVDFRATTHVGIAIDVETNGLNANHNQIIELALRRFRYNDSGAIVRLDHSYSWFEDPCEPLNDVITSMTGITDDMVAGQEIDTKTATLLINSADICVAHNAAFDRRFVERRLPGCTNKAWGCSLKEIDWHARSFDRGGRGLAWLLSECGFFHDGHRAAADVDALIAILSHRFAGGGTALSELLANAEKRTWLFRAVGAAFEVKDALKAKGYSWNAEERVWQRDVSDTARLDELAWLAANVYAPEWLPRTDGPSLHEMTKFNRYAG